MEYRFNKDINIPIGKIVLHGDLAIPQKASALVVFSHGSGSSRFSSRNKAVAKYLQENNFGTLLFDLLTEEEDRNYENRFNIDLLSERLASVTLWLEKQAFARNCLIGYFGASTGAASALKAAALLPHVKAVVSRGGRPDLAMEKLSLVKAPTLLIVGSLDHDVLQLNRKAYLELEGEKELAVVDGATHLFEEQGMMALVSELACNWFKKYLGEVRMASKDAGLATAG